MGRIGRYSTAFLFFIWTAFSLSAQVPDDKLPAKPYPPVLVNDFAHVLQPDQISALEQKLEAYSDSTSTQIAVVTLPTTAPYEISDFTVSLGRYWGIGQKGANNGVVLLLAMDDHAAWLSTGYGAEGALTDAISRRIIQNVLVPDFQDGNYYAGIDKSTDAIMLALAGEFDAGDAYGKGNNNSYQNLALWIFIVIIILYIISRRNKGGGTTYTRGGTTYWGGGFGGFGGGGGGFGGFGGGSFGGGGAGGRW